MKIKKIITNVLLSALLILSSCGKSDSPTSTDSSSSNANSSSSSQINSSSSMTSSSSIEVIVPTDGVPLLANQAMVSSFFGTSNVKLVYSYNDFLYLVSYAGENITSQKLTGTEGAILPMISPDGKWILYAKGPKGDLVNDLAATSSAYILNIDVPNQMPIELVKDNAFEPRFVMTSEDKYEIVYATKGLWGSWDGIGETYLAEFDGSTIVDTQDLMASGAYVGGYNGEYLASAGDRAVLKNLNLNTPFDTVYSIPLTDADGNVTIPELQVCNPSIIPSLTNAGYMMGLDFGSASKTNPDINNGEKWGLHDVIFVLSHDKKVVRDILVPDRKSVYGMITDDDSYTGHSWDDSEWSNHPYFASSGLAVTRSWETYPGSDDWVGSTVGDEIFENAYAIDLRTGAKLHLATTPIKTQTGSEHLKWPMIWVEKSMGFVEESSWLQ